MAAGRYRLDVQVPGFARSIRYFEAGMGESVSLPDIVLSSGGHIECHGMLNYSPEHLNYVQLRRIDDAGRTLESFDLFEPGDVGGARAPLVGVTIGIEPGTHRIAVAHGWSVWQELVVEVREGETTLIEPLLEAGTFRRVAIQEPDGSPCRSLTLQEVFDESGDRVGVISESKMNNRPHRPVGYLAVGRYTFRIRDEVGRTASGILDVTDLHRPASDEVALTLTLPGAP